MVPLVTKGRHTTPHGALARRSRRNPEDPGFRSVYDSYAMHQRQTADVLTKLFDLDLEGIAKLKKPTLPALSSAFYTYVDGRNLTSKILTSKSIPSAKIKKFERAARAFGYKKAPSDITSWFVKNHASIEFLLESSQWPNISDLDDVPSASGVEVITQVTGDTSFSIKLLEDAISAMSSSGIHEVDRVIYGKIYIVGEIAKRKRIAAFYNYIDDDVYVIKVKRFDSIMPRALIHEFGHRYWMKVAPTYSKSEWSSFHRTLKDQAVELKTPNEGDAILDSTVSYVAGNAIFLKGGGYVKLDNYFDWLRERQIAERFPTIYATTNAEEHFCECFSFYCLGSLTGPSLEVFETLFVSR